MLERRSAFHEEGAGIQIGPNGTRILKLLKVAEALRPHVGTPEAIRVRDGASGDELARLPWGAGSRRVTARPTGSRIGRTCTPRFYRPRAPSR